MTRTLLILTCLCAVGLAQFTASPSAFAQSSFSNTRFQSRAQSQQGFQSRAQQQQGFQGQQQGFQSRNQNNQGAFVNQPEQQARSGGCRESNERYPVSGSCDRYVECINGTSEEKLCPDGLRFNPNVNFNVYPCQYPNDVPCLERSSLQPPQPTESCPHQFGYFKTGDASHCSGFRNCVNGMGFDLNCPEGLAFSSETYRCEWPDQVQDCDAEAFLGFRCPAVPESKELGPPAGYRFYRADTNCQKYFICIEGRPRALSCSGDAAFDELTSTCVSADEVPACPAELREAAKRSRDLEQQRLARELQINAIPAQQRRRFQN